MFMGDSSVSSRALSPFFLSFFDAASLFHWLLLPLLASGLFLFAYPKTQ